MAGNISVYVDSQQVGAGLLGMDGADIRARVTRVANGTIGEVLLDDTYVDEPTARTAIDAAAVTAGAVAEIEAGLGVFDDPVPVTYEESLGNPATDGHILSSLVDGTRSWVAPAIGGGGPTLLKAKGTGTASLDDVEAAIPWAAAVIDQLGGDVTISGSEITAVAAGVYKFTVTLRTDSANRTELFIRTYIDADGASGYTQDTDEIVSDYVSRDGDQDTGAVTLSTALDLAAGAKVEFRGFGDTDGTCVMLPAGTILLVEAY